VSFYKAGVDPGGARLMSSVIALAYPAQRTDLERATDLVRLFREQPTGDLQRTARSALRAAVSPNERLQALWHPWTSYVIVPLFALANAGVQLSGSFLSKAFTSPVTLGIVFGYVLGKPIGIVGSTWLATQLAAGGCAPVGWASVGGKARSRGSASRSRSSSPRLPSTMEPDEAKVGALTAAPPRPR
jgi:Na+/H+ antiporter NhaA